MIAFGCVMIFISLGGFGEYADRPLLALLLAGPIFVSGLLFFRGAPRTGVEIGASGLAIFNPVLTRHIPWSRVKAISHGWVLVSRIPYMHGNQVYIELRNGKQIAVPIAATDDAAYEWLSDGSARFIGIAASTAERECD